MRFIKYFVILLFLYLNIFCQMQYIFSGNKDYSVSKLEGLIKEDWQKYIENKDISYVDDAAYKITQSYRKDGYHFSVVDYELKQKQIIFSIREHSRVTIKNVAIKNKNGNAELFFSYERLKKFITPPPTFGAYIFKKSQIESDAAAIASFYISQGFLKAYSEVEYIFFPDAPDSHSVSIIIYVFEGPRAYLRKISFLDNTFFSEKELLLLLAAQRQDVFIPGMHHKMGATLKTFYREHGYAQVDVRPKIIIKASEQQYEENIFIEFKIKEGQKNYIRQIDVKGNQINSTKLIEQQLTIKPGELFCLSEIVTTEQNIQRTELFLFVEIEEKIVNENALDLVIHVKEKERQAFSFSLGYNTTYGVVGSVTYENISIFGSGWRFVADVESTIYSPNLSRSNFEVKLTDPWFWGKRDLAFSIAAFAILEETPSFTVFDRGSDIFFTKNFIQMVSPSGLVQNVLSGEVGYRLSFSEVLDAEDDLDDEEGLTVFSTFHQKLILDLTDNRIYPTSGTYSFLELEQSLTDLGSDVDYAKLYLHSAWYYNIFMDWVLAVALRGGVIVPYNDSEIPIQKRFFGGGATTVRSFKENELPPLDADDNPIGGEGIFLASIELRIPIYGGLGISTFVDSGEVIEKVRTFNDYRISQIKYGVGMGIWYNIPHLGALRADIAFNPDREENPLSGNEEDAFNFFVSIGFAF